MYSRTTSIPGDWPSKPTSTRSSRADIDLGVPVATIALREHTHLKQLEAEGIQIIREVAAQLERPVMLYFIGKDSAVMLHAAL